MAISLRSKIVIIIIIIATALSFTAAYVSNSVMVNMISKDFRTRATDLANTVAASVDASLADKLKMAVNRVFDETENKVGNDKRDTPEYEEYIANFESVAESGAYSRMLESLRKIQKVNQVECIYLVYLDVETESVVYIVDADEQDPCPTGSFDPLYDVNRSILVDPTIGFPAYITDTEEYGWLVTAGAPVMTSGNKVAAYTMVDISMNDVRSQQKEFLVTLSGILALITAIVSVLSILFVNYAIVKPINQISRAAAKYKTDDPSASSGLFEAIKIKKRDEIGVLANSIKKMGQDINAQIAELISVNRQLSDSRREVHEMNELANKDSLTGIRNRLAYDEDLKRLNISIAEGGARFGIAMIDLNYLKKINDTWGHERGNDALIKICKMICETFVHSPVFRIGGDEFAVILENSDYDNAASLIEIFKEKAAAAEANTNLQPWERTSAAIGSSMFDPEIDDSADDVFRRADKEMYEAKKKMKSIRKN